MGEVAVTLCVLLWAQAGREADLSRYEDRVLALLGDHSGRVVQRARVEGGDGEPAEVQILQFASAAAVEGYMNDPRRTTLAAQRDATIARTDVLRATLL